MFPLPRVSRAASAVPALRSDQPALPTPAKPLDPQASWALMCYIDDSMHHAHARGKALGEKLRSELMRQTALAENRRQHLRLAGLESDMDQLQIALEALAPPEPGHYLEATILEVNFEANAMRTDLGLPRTDAAPMQTMAKNRRRLALGIQMSLKALHLERIGQIVAGGDLGRMRELRDAHIDIRTQLIAQSNAVGSGVEKAWSDRNSERLLELAQLIQTLDKGIAKAEKSETRSRLVKEGEHRVAVAQARIADIETQLLRIGDGVPRTISAGGGIRSRRSPTAMTLNEQILRQEVHILDQRIANLNAQLGLGKPSQEEAKASFLQLHEATQQCWEKFRDASENSPPERRFGQEYHYLMTRQNAARVFLGAEPERHDPYKHKALQKLQFHLRIAYGALDAGSGASQPEASSALGDVRRRKADLLRRVERQAQEGASGPELAAQYEQLDALTQFETQLANPQFVRALRLRSPNLPDHIKQLYTQLQAQLEAQGLSKEEVRAALVMAIEPSAVPAPLMDGSGFLHGPVARRPSFLQAAAQDLPLPTPTKIKAGEMPDSFPPEGLTRKFDL
jgi:hypothetical protein